MRTSPNIYPPTNPQTVAVLWQMPPQPHEVIGIASVLGAQAASDVHMLRKLQKAAADIGADAVVVQREDAMRRGLIAGGGSPAGWGLLGSYDEFPKNRGLAIKYIGATQRAPLRSAAAAN